jgi:hypothetical protein
MTTLKTNKQELLEEKISSITGVSGLSYVEALTQRISVTDKDSFDATLAFIRSKMTKELYDTLLSVTPLVIEDVYPTCNDKKMEDILVLNMDNFGKFRILLVGLLGDDVIAEIRENYQFNHYPVDLS